VTILRDKQFSVGYEKRHGYNEPCLFVIKISIEGISVVL
jgi:hypothetical protein